MKIALIGSSGNLGSRVLDELLARRHEVTGITRNRTLTERPSFRSVSANAGEAASLAPALADHDAIITAIQFLGLKAEELLEGIRRSGVKRVLVSGHSGSLLAEGGTQLLETTSMSDFVKPEALDAREAFKLLRKADDLDWTYLAPAALLTPGKRTEQFRLGGDQVIRDRLGESRISMEDLAIVIADEIENPRHIRKRFTAAY